MAEILAYAAKKVKREPSFIPTPALPFLLPQGEGRGGGAERRER